MVLYPMHFRYPKKLIVIAFAVLMLAACGGHKENTPLYIHAGFEIGTAVGAKEFATDSLFRAILVREFNSITAENIMKMAHLQPVEGVFQWAKADSLAAFCARYNKRLHGHALNWYLSTPAWAKAYAGDSAALENILKNHITRVVEQFKGKAASWDVVNEAILDSTGAYRKSIWYNTLGPEYIARAFTYARAADPDALLFYNDYSLTSDTVKRAAVLALIAELKANNVPIDGIGLQEHIYMDSPSIDEIRKALKEFVATGLLIHISELDISFNHFEKPPVYLSFTDSMAQWQRERYRQVVAAYTELVPDSQKYGITMWGFADKYTWVCSYFDQPDWPCLYDTTLSAKPAYQGFVEGLKVR